MTTLLQSFYELAARSIGAERSDIPGLWLLPTGEELTTGQIIDIVSHSFRGASEAAMLDVSLFGTGVIGPDGKHIPFLEYFHGSDTQEESA